jgi:DNA-binding GntR family transcriptional regulator
VVEKAGARPRASAAFDGAVARERPWSRAADADKISDSRYNEQLAIIEALRRRDPDAAEIAARVHVTNALRDILKVLLR